ncbi:hypothetical protein T265_10743 [Opisthorchis viverrini]|uniref:Uncharacterized protein n=1 Tax=Opisthorchis viverrini TaxID=6198 RepID=A0A074ZC50_OPIVI|nr:hypothetical protein T265_10743 [Opisthorchis viverrini]KER20785.1 hypothetical protein T265_10743 [Opisthorchis viverrini]
MLVLGIACGELLLTSNLFGVANFSPVSRISYQLKHEVAWCNMFSCLENHKREIQLGSRSPFDSRPNQSDVCQFLPSATSKAPLFHLVTPCATHKSVISAQKAHNGEQTQVTVCDLRKSQYNNSLGGLRKADPSIRNDHRLVDQNSTSQPTSRRAEIMAREPSLAPYFCFFSFHIVPLHPSETMLTFITVARRS